ncbi:MAG: hypothetical protein KAV70_01090, partial [Bacteroidales bacterium]|nr:hypothetical protein [Bacteroidales bacterium]
MSSRNREAIAAITTIEIEEILILEKMSLKLFTRFPVIIGISILSTLIPVNKLVINDKSNTNKIIKTAINPAAIKSQYFLLNRGSSATD